MAQLYRSNGTIEEYPAPANGKDYQLEELQAAIGGGYIEIVPTKDGRLMVIDEEGKLKEMPRNQAATQISNTFPGDYIAGDALVCDGNQIN